MEKYVGNAKWLQVLEKWWEQEDEGKQGQGKAAISTCECVCREVCVFSCPLSAREKTGLWLCYERQDKCLPSAGLAFSKWSRSHHCPKPPPVSTVGSCRSSWHAQKPPPFPPHHAHVRLCCGCVSFVTVHTWVRNSFDSFWVTKLFWWLVRKPGL